MSEDSGTPNMAEGSKPQGAPQTMPCAKPPRLGYERLPCEQLTRSVKRLQALESQEACLDSIERMLKQGFYLVLGCAIVASLGVWPLGQFPGVWGAGVTIASAIYATFLWWRHQRIYVVIRTRAALESDMHERTFGAGPAGERCT